MLYTLSLFALEGKRWVSLYEWRCLTDLELCAIGVFWRQIAKDLDICSSDLGISDETSGLDWLRVLERWSCNYENEHMAPHPCNHTLAVATLDLLGAELPSPARPFASAAFCYLMGPKLRDAMRYVSYSNLIYDEPQLTRANHSMPTPSSLTVALGGGLLRTRKSLLRHLALPRSQRSGKIYISSSASASDSDRYPALRYRAFPWYIPSTRSARLKAWLKGDPQPGPQFYDCGYKLLELGPDELRGKGEAEMAEMIGSICSARGVE